MGARIAAAGLVLGVSTVAVPNPPGGVEGIPPRALQAYVQASAGAPCKLPWWDLAAVGAVESGHGTHGGAHIQDDGTMSVMAVSYADAYGPMQFILPTWKTYGQGDVNDIDDAAPATARMLCADGYETDRMDAFEAYNGGGYRGPETRRYAASVDEFSQRYRQADKLDLPSLESNSAGKERSWSRVGERALSGWLHVGRNAQAVGLGGAWRAVDDLVFGPSESKPAKLTGARPDGLNAEFGARLDRLIADAPGSITVISGKRTAAEQLELYERYQAGVGNLAAWSDGVSCSSDHCAGYAADLAYADEITMAWAHAHAAGYGLQFDVAGEDWHVSLRGELR